MTSEKLRKWWTRVNLWLDRLVYPDEDTTYEEWQAPLKRSQEDENGYN